MFQFLDNSRGWRVVGDVVVCPVCERRSVYNRGEDRFFHLDGSANAECWCAISGGLVPRPIVAHDNGEHQAQRANAAASRQLDGEPGRAAARVA
jgi:hypothetical protein